MRECAILSGAVCAGDRQRHRATELGSRQWHTATELYPFRISIRFFARHHAAFSGPATPLCLAASRVSIRHCHYVLFTGNMSRRRVVKHSACFTH